MLFFEKEVYGLKYQRSSEDLLKSYRYASFLSIPVNNKVYRLIRQNIDNV